MCVIRKDEDRQDLSAGFLAGFRRLKRPPEYSNPAALRKVRAVQTTKQRGDEGVSRRCTRALSVLLD
jgi:hypothetical protein